MNVLQVVSKVAETDERTAKIIVHELLYDALSEEIERLRPQLEIDVAKAMGQVAGEGLRTLSKSSAPGREQVASHLAGLVLLAKASGDNRATPWYDARDESGRFTRAIADGMRMLTRSRDDSLEGKGKDVISGVKGDQYDRARMLGNALTAVNSPETRAVGTLSRVIGELGPEAQDAFEPGLRRLAYRYRGTEKRPSQDLQRASSVIARIADGDVPDEQSQPKARAAMQSWLKELGNETRRDTMQTAGMRGGGPREKLSAEAAALATLSTKGRTADQQRLEAVGTLGVLHLRGHVPNPDLTNISRAAGRMPPSVGLLMDSRGRVVSEAMGYNGDHYLPFDLKNLKSLRGGQYVRTRAGGGPTDEDIYTGLMTGARQIQVVSNSGVFTLEFDPDLRGGRRYSDKAKQMVDRYGKLVAAIETGGVTATPLSRDRMKTLRAEALADANNNPELAETYLKDKVLQEQARAKFEDIDEDDLREQARAVADREWKAGQTGNKPTTSTRTRLQTERDVFNQLKTQALEGRFRQYKADGEGYEAALRALQQEFPYFIRRVNREPLGDYLMDRKQLEPNEPIPGRGGRDPGYTKPGGLAPTDMDEGSHRKWTRDRSTPATAAPTAAPSAAPGAAPEAQAAPATQQAPAAAPARSPGGSKALAEELVAPSVKAKRALNNALARTLLLRNSLNERQNFLQPLGGYDKSSAHEITDSGQWSGWFANEYASDPDETLDWLLTEANPINFSRAIAALSDMGKLVAQFPDDPIIGDWDPKDFEQAVDTMKTVQQLRQPFAPAGDNPVMADPMNTKAPQPFPEIVGLPAEPAALDEYLLAKPEVAQAAKDMEGKDDRKIADEISDEVQQLTQLEAADPNSGQAARQYQLALQNKQTPPRLAALEAKQKAWALRRSAKLLAFQRGEEMPPFAKAARRRPLQVVLPGSPVAKAFASRSARSPRPQRRPAPR